MNKFHPGDIIAPNSWCYYYVMNNKDGSMYGDSIYELSLVYSYAPTFSQIHSVEYVDSHFTLVTGVLREDL